MTARPRPKKPSPLKTYSHLAGARRMPNEYEIATTNLQWHPRAGFEVNVPLAAWYARWQRGSPLACDDWERFRDPRETTYTKYVEHKRAREAYVDGLLESFDASGYDRELPAEWRPTLASTLAPLRFPVHGLQMIAAYVGQMAPGGRITIACALQAADEARRTERLAYRMTQLAIAHPGFGDDSRARWEKDAAWQPLRAAIERLLVTWDWGEAFVALNLCLKPLVDEAFMVRLPALGKTRGDPMLAPFFAALEEDCRWHRAWSRALCEVAIAARPENRGVIGGWVREWAPRARDAVAALAAIEGLAELGDAASYAPLLARELAPLGLEAP